MSISLVLLGHLSGTDGFTTLNLPLGDYANLGVRVFFVISGFLITSLLLKERQATGRIDLKAFYVRRVFRIFPAFYAYLMVLGLLRAAGFLELPMGDLLSAMTFTTNFLPSRAWTVGHTWSLSVEEQFYLLWPATLWFAGTRRALAVGFAVLLLAPLLRVAWYYAFPNYEALIGEAFPTIADSIAAGCVLAAIRDSLWEKINVYRRLLSSRAFGVVPVTALIVNAIPYAMPNWLMGQTIINVAIAMTVDRCIRFPAGISGRFLNWRPVTFVGVLSYSLYLWQQPFLNRHSSSVLATFPLNLALAFFAALGSYYLVERPALRRRQQAALLAREAPMLGARARPVRVDRDMS